VQQAGHRYQTAVVSLGLNDVLPERWAACLADPDGHLDRFLTTIGPVPVMWLPPPDRCGARNGPQVATFRAALARSARRFPNVRILDSNSLFCAPGRLRDGVHLTDDGYLVLAQLVRRARAQLRSGPMRIRFSLHAARSPKTCSWCGWEVPAASEATAGEYWRSKGCTPALVICCACHWLLGLPTDGWEVPAHGRAVVASAVPAEGGAHDLNPSSARALTATSRDLRNPAQSRMLIQAAAARPTPAITNRDAAVVEHQAFSIV
jgi:hypothetical protein